MLASFLGIGLGFLRANGARDLFGFAPIALAALVAFVRLFPVEIDRSGTDLIFFGALGTRSGLPPFVTLPVLFVGVAVVMALVGEGVARTFRRFPPLEAYRLDILGSLAGIVALTLVAGQSSLRLESYLFTAEAMQAARAHLTPGGAFGEYNYYREQWLVDRLAGTLQQVYGHPPCVDSTGQLGRLALLMVSSNRTALQCPTIWRPAGTPPPPATDDYPFLYLQERTIPGFYLLTLALILAGALLLVRLGAGPLKLMGRYLDLFCMGAAFLLLETKNVVQFALLFGTTWFVNALVFIGILLAVYLAIEVARRIDLGPPWRLYVALLAALGVAWLVQPNLLLALPVVPRFVIAIVVAFAPVFLANLVFARRFRDVAASNLAFATNLLGAMVGGVLEYAALVTGYRALLIVIALLYAGAFMLQRSQRRARLSPA